MSHRKIAILIAGMHRSGTSALSRSLNLVGCDLPKTLMEPVPDNNETGFWESRPLSDLNTHLLRSTGSDWKDWWPFDPGWYASPTAGLFREQAQALLHQEFGERRLFVLKDPRLCRLLPFWIEALETFGAEPRVVLPIRNPLDVAASLKQRDGISPSCGYLIWLRYMLEAESGSRNLRRACLRYETLLSEPHAVMDRLGRDLDVSWPKRASVRAHAEIERFLSPGLHHHHSDDAAFLRNPVLSHWLGQCFELFNRWSHGEVCETDAALLDRIRSAFDEATPLFSRYIAECEQAVAERDGRIEGLSETVAERDGRIEGLSEALAERDGRIEGLSETVAERDGRIEGLSEALAERDGRIEGLSETVAERDGRIEGLSEALAERDGRIEGLSEALAERDRRIEGLSEALAERDGRIEALHRSISMRTTAPLRYLGRISRWLLAEVRASASRIARGIYRRAPLPLSTKMHIKGRLFRLAPSLFKHTMAYQRWAAFTARAPDAARSLPHGLRTGVKNGFQAMPSMDSGRGFDPGELVHGPDLPHLRMPRNRLIEEFQKFGSTAAKDLPVGIREMAERELAEDRPTVSVIMPVWNREKFICRAIQSVLAQSYMPHEIIVVDDGSNDSSRDVVRGRFATEINSGIVRLIEKPHTGVCDTRNAGLKSATGDLIAYLDSDNTWRRDYLLVMAALFSSAKEVATAYTAFHHHNLDSGVDRLHSVPYDRKKLLIQNFIDLNTFMHRRHIYLQNGGFDVDLSRLVDWDFIISVTRRYSPVFVPYVGADYYLDKAELGNITYTEDLGANMKRVQRKNVEERIRHGLVPMKLAYVLWDWPALSQTFVLEELRWLVRNGQDVIVYFKIEPDRAAELDFEIDAHRVRDTRHLAELLVRDGRTLCHTHFAAPAAHALTWPASKATGIPFTLFAHAVDIFHDHNRNRNRIAEVVRDPRCLKVFVHGDHQRRFLEEQGVPTEKIAFNMQAVDLSEFEKVPPLADLPSPPSKVRRGILIGRFIEKKGIEVLIDAAARLQGTPVAFDVYGYGPLETSCRKKLAELGIENVNIKGPLDGARAVAAAIGEADFLVVPSIVAADGDREGFPTVILEAMAAGRPVIASAVSAVPDYLRDMAEAILVTPGDPHSLADGVRRLLSMTPERREAMLSEARNFLRRHAGTERTLRCYVDIWQSRPVDVFMVTYNTAEYENRAETFEIIRRVLRHTTTPFTLTIVDNNSDPDFRRELIELCTGRSNVRLVFLKDNLLCGPASNMAMALGDASFSIYLCSKEAFVGKHGWERYLIDHMRRNPSHAMAGYRTHLPRFTLGREIVGHPDFAKFRNQEFAKRNPDRVFTHVQGGVYIIRRSVIGRHGGFSEQIPQSNMDVEFSYFLESQGEELGAIGEVASLTVKTRPTLSAVLDEHTVVAHPLTLETARSLLDARRNGRRACCNVCNAESASILEDAGTCAQCGSTPFGRSVFQRLAHDWRTNRGGHAVLLTMDPALGKALGARMFQVVYHGRDPASAAEGIASMKGKVDLAVVDTDCFAASAPGSAEGRQGWSSLAAGLAPGGLVLYPGAGSSSGNPPLYGGLGCRPTDASEREERDDDAPRALSRVLGHDWRRIREIPGLELR